MEIFVDVLVIDLFLIVQSLLLLIPMLLLTKSVGTNLLVDMIRVEIDPTVPEESKGYDCTTPAVIEGNGQLYMRFNNIEQAYDILQQYDQANVRILASGHITCNLQRGNSCTSCG